MLRESSHGTITRVQLARTAFGRPLYKVSVFQLGDTLIDTGCPATSRELLRWARGRGIERLVITHHHEDHAGGASLLARELGVRVFAPAAAVSVLGRYYRLPIYRRVVWGQPANVRARPLGDVVAIGPYRLRPIPTPGHAPDHVALFEPERRWLFTGDLFLGLRVAYLRAVEDAHRILRSLRALAALEPELLICSHTGFVTGGTRALIRRIEWWERLELEARALRERGLTVRRITRRLLGREGAMAWASGGAFAKRHLVSSLLRGPVEPGLVYPGHGARDGQAGGGSMKRFSVAGRGPKEFVDGVNEKLSAGPLGEIASVGLEGDTLAVRFSQMGTTELFYAVAERDGGFAAELTEERVAPFHAPFRAEFEKKFAEIMTDLGADVES